MVKLLPFSVAILMGIITFGSGCADVPDPSTDDSIMKTQAIIIDASATEGECPVIDELLALRDPKLYTKKLNEAISAITMGTDTLPVGSFRYSEQKYPGDIDIFETVEVPLAKEDAKKYYAQRLSNIAERVAADPDLTLSDFKAGKDARFKIDIGDNQGSFGIVGYNYSKVKDALQKLKNQGLLSAEELKNLMTLAKQNPSADEWADLKEGLRQFSVLRWNIDELLNKKKHLRGGQELTLSDAIDGSLVKIDVLAPVTKLEGYTEVTTIFNLLYTENGKKHSITEPLANYRESVTKDVVTFFEKSHRKHLKGAKRLWLLATIAKDWVLTAQLMPLLQGSAAALNQVISESEIDRKILEQDRVPCSPVTHRILRQIESFEKRIIDNSTDFPLALLSNQETGLIRTTFNAFQRDCGQKAGHDQVLSAKTKEIAIKNLTKLEDTIRPFVDTMAKNFLSEVGVDPNDPLASLSGERGVCPRIKSKGMIEERVPSEEPSPIYPDRNQLGELGEVPYTNAPYGSGFLRNYHFLTAP